MTSLYDRHGRVPALVLIADQRLLVLYAEHSSVAVKNSRLVGGL